MLELLQSLLLYDCGVILPYKEKKTRKISERVTQQTAVLTLNIPVQRNRGFLVI